MKASGGQSRARSSLQMVALGLPCLIGGTWWVWMLGYEVQVFFTGEDPDDSILFLPVLWIPGLIFACLGFWLTLKAILHLWPRTERNNPKT